MATMSHESAQIEERRRSRPDLVGPEMWASLAIVVMWVAVVVDAIVGPDIQIDSATGDHVTIPTAGGLALFAFLGTWVVARYGFRRQPKN